MRSAIEDAEQRLNGHGRLVDAAVGHRAGDPRDGRRRRQGLVEEVVDDIVDALTDVAA